MPRSALGSVAFGIPAWQGAAVVVAAYSLAALLVACVTHSAAARPLPEAARDLWCAAMIWAALSVCIALLVRNWPVSRLGFGRSALLYGAVVAGASWIVNGAFLALYISIGAANPDDLPARLHELSLRHLPFNAAAAVALIACFHWRQSAQELRTAGRKRAATAGAVDRLPVCSGARRFSVPVDSIEWMEAADDYVVLHCASESHICNERLYRLERALAHAGFFRVHRSVLVNLHRVVALTGRPHETLRLELPSGRAVAVSRRRQRQVRQAVLGNRQPLS